MSCTAPRPQDAPAAIPTAPTTPAGAHPPEAQDPAEPPAGATDAAALVAHFDRLVEDGVPLGVLLTGTARLAACPVGLVAGDGHLATGADEHGRVIRENRPEGALVRPLSRGGEVWLGRTGQPLPLDRMLLERFAVAASVCLRERAARLPERDDPALLELVVSDRADEIDRARALGLLGFAAGVPLTVCAVEAAERELERVTAQFGVGGATVKATGLGDVALVVRSGGFPADLCVPVGVRIGVGPPVPGLDAPFAWREARAALRFALPSRHARQPYGEAEAAVVHAGVLGGFTLLARLLPPEAIDEVADVAALDRLAREPGGADMLRTLEAVAATESLRKAAKSLHLHHNSVSHRLARAERVLGFSVGGPYRRARLMLALVLHRLRDSEAGPGHSFSKRRVTSPE